MTISPYLNFDGRCEEAINFYKSALGAEVEMLMRFKDQPQTPSQGNCKTAPGTEDKVMHASLRIGNSVILASDCHAQGKPEFKGVSLSIQARDDAQATKIFNALTDGGTVCVPLAKTFFSSSFGVATDRFGVTWMIVVMP
jgi:PhnB protein